MILAQVGPISVALKIKLGFGPEIPKKKKEEKNEREKELKSALVFHVLCMNTLTVSVGL